MCIDDIEWFDTENIIPVEGVDVLAILENDTVGVVYFIGRMFGDKFVPNMSSSYIDASSISAWTYFDGNDYI